MNVMDTILITVIFFAGFTALHSAVFVHSVQIVSYLVSLGANVNMQVCFISFCSVIPFPSFLLYFLNKKTGTGMVENSLNLFKSIC